MKQFWKRMLSMAAAGCLLVGGIPFAGAADEDQSEEATPVRKRQGISQIYPTAYADWENGFMTGNGKMGIIVFGDPLNDTIVYNDRGFNKAANLNEATRTFNEVPQETLDAIKKACAEGDFQTANDLANEAHGWKNGGDGNRHPGYRMTISIPEDGEVTDYSRVCDYTTGEITVNWSDNRGDWSRSSFVSREDNVVVQQLTAPTEGKLTCSIALGIDTDMKMFNGMTFAQNNSTQYLNFRAKYGNNTGDAGYEGVTRVEVTGGTATLEGDTLKVEGADSLILLTQTEKYTADSTTEWEKEAIQERLADLSTDYATLLERHTAIHTEIYNRVSVDYKASEEERAMTNEALLAMQKETDDPVKALYERMFDAGRFYFLCSGYEYAVTDLGGVWAGDTNAGWGGFYHLDANLNLQISGGVIGDMPEVMEGYFYLNEAWAEDFQTNAQKLLGCRGLLAGGNSPGAQSGLISALSYYYPYQYVTGEEAWLLYPFWEYYQVTGDKEFLEDRFYPLLRQMGDFYEDFLTETDEDGNYIFAGSISPENQPSNLKLSLVNNSTFDISSARFALTTLIEVCDILGTEQGDGEGVERWTEMLSKFPEYRINDDGALAEWAWEGLDDSYGHRHSSHLIGVWPYREITPESDETLYDAAVVALEMRDKHFTADIGHGVLHNALIAANLKDGSSVGYRLNQLASNDFYFDSMITSHNGDRGTFCTDASHAVPGIMMEMLISSDADTLEFLPALPEGLEQGSITGVKGRNQTTIEELTWDTDSNVVTATVRSDIDQTLTIMERQGIRKIETQAEVRNSELGRMAREVTLEAGESTTITLYLDEVDETAGNLAEGKTAVASSEKNDTPASGIVYRTADMAVDGNEATRWASNQTDNEWIYVDLGKTFDLTSVVLKWETAYGKAYKIQVSDDATTWTDLYETTTGAGGTETIPVQGSGRYVRMLGLQRGSTWGYSLYELEVYGQSPDRRDNLAAYRPVDTLTEKDTYYADLALDGDPTTAWQSTEVDTEELVVSLDDQYAIKEVTLTWGEPYATAYTLQVSDDQTTWIDLYTATEAKGGVETLTLSGTGRYLRLQMTESSGTGYVLAELEAYGTSTAPPPADKTALKAAIVYPLNEELYTEASWEAYQEALNAAREVSNNKDVLQEEVDAALQSLLDARDQLTIRYLGAPVLTIPTNGKTYTANQSVLGTDWLTIDPPVDLVGKDLGSLYMYMTVTLTNDSDTDDALAFKTGKLRLGSVVTDGQRNDVTYDIAGMAFNFHEGENILYFPLFDSETGYFQNGDGTMDWSCVNSFRMYIDSLNQYAGNFTLTVSDIQILDTTVEPTPSVIYGDIDANTKVETNDALLALQAATAKITLTDDQKLAGNVSKDTEVTSEDALLILQFATKKISSFPIEG